MICLDPLFCSIRVYDNLKIHVSCFKVSFWIPCAWKKSFKMWHRYSWEAQKPVGKGKESRAFVCGHVISKLNTHEVPLFPLALARFLQMTSPSADVSVYSPFQHTSITSVLEVSVREMRTTKHVIAVAYHLKRTTRNCSVVIWMLCNGGWMCLCSNYQKN